MNRNDFQGCEKMSSGTWYLGYRPSEERIKEKIKEIIETHIITKIEININRDEISYWYINDVK